MIRVLGMTQTSKGKALTAATRAVLRAAAVGAIGLNVVACTSSVKKTAQLGGWSPAADRPIIISGTPARDSKANDQADQQLSESDWKALQQLGPRPIWDRIAELNKSA